MSLERFTRKEVAAAPADAPVGEVAAIMRNRHVGAVVVLDGGKPIGIVTDRDLATRVVAERLSATVPVRMVMSGDLVTAEVEDDVESAILAMRRYGVRRLPIVDGGGALVGMVALDDLLVLLAGELSSGAQAVMDNRGP